MAGWLRLYTDIKNDRKLRRLPTGQRWLWVVILALAKESPQPGWLFLSEGVPVTIDDLTDEAAIPAEEVTSGIEIFKAQHMIEEVDGLYHLVNWDKRQFASDNSTERWRNWKDKKGQKPTLDQQPANVEPTPPEYRVQSTETDISSKDMSAPDGAGACDKTPKATTPRKASRKNGDYTPEFIAVYEMWPRKDDKKDAFKGWNARIKDGFTPEQITLAASNYIANNNASDPQYIKMLKTFLGPGDHVKEWLKHPEQSTGHGKISRAMQSLQEFAQMED